MSQDSSSSSFNIDSFSRSIGWDRNRGVPIEASAQRRKRKRKKKKKAPRKQKKKAVENFVRALGYATESRSREVTPAPPRRRTTTPRRSAVKGPGKAPRVRMSRTRRGIGKIVVKGTGKGTRYYKVVKGLRMVWGLSKKEKQTAKNYRTYFRTTTGNKKNWKEL